MIDGRKKPERGATAAPRPGGEREGTQCVLGAGTAGLESVLPRCAGATKAEVAVNEVRATIALMALELLICSAVFGKDVCQVIDARGGGQSGGGGLMICTYIFFDLIIFGKPGGEKGQRWGVRGR